MSDSIKSPFNPSRLQKKIEYMNAEKKKIEYMNAEKKKKIRILEEIEGYDIVISGQRYNDNAPSRLISSYDVLNPQLSLNNSLPSLNVDIIGQVHD